MSRHLLAFAFAPLLCFAPTTTLGEPPSASPKHHIRLVDPRDGKTFDSAALKGHRALVVLFLGTQCPVNNEYLPELIRLHAEYAPKRVAFVGVNANRQDTPAAVADHARKAKLSFPVVKDPGNKVADALGARRTPEAVVLSPAGEILYQGRIDDQFGTAHRRPGKPTRRDLACALDDVLSGKTPSVARTEASGCAIGRIKPTRADGDITYTKHVSRILQQHCGECHRAGQIGPMTFDRYEDVVGWADTIREVIDDGRMPPWHADPAHGTWANDRRLSAKDKKTLAGWLAGGMARGNDKDMPPAKVYPVGWRIGKPDAVFTMDRTYEVPAETPKGGVPYKYFYVETNFKEDKWIERAEARPGAPDVVHHQLAFIVPPGKFFNPEAPGSVLCGMAPGDMPLMLEPGFAKLVPAGSRLMFQMHYTPNGKARSDRSSVAVVFAKQPPKHKVYTKPILNKMFVSHLLSIPPGAENFEIVTDMTFRDDVHVMAFLPHMHLRGKDFRYDAVGPDGKTMTLLNVPRYDFNWQSVYRPTKNIPLAKGTKLNCVAHYDNSAKNANNPDPTQRLYWGDQTWEEMMVGWIDYYVDGEKP